MPLAGWVRERLWRTSNWCAELAQIRQGLATERRSATTLERMCEVAWATEYCDPDRGRALSLYLDVWRGGHTAAHRPAKHLAGLLGAHLALAEIAAADGDLVAAGTAFLDAGFPELAVDPLERFVKARPPGASAVTENVRVEGVTALLALARGQRFDAEREIAASLDRARHATSAAAAAAYLHAARVARAAHLDDRLATILAAAVHACPDDPTIATLVEARLFESGKTDELLAHYSARLERTKSRAEYAERARMAGVALIAGNLQPGLGLRLLRMSLESAYAALLPDITSHIAAWELLWTHAQVHHTTVELAPLIAQALSAPLPEDDALYLAQLGLEISWRHAADPVSAKPYAEMLLAFVPDHPQAAAFVIEAAPEMLAAPDDVPEVLPSSGSPIAAPPMKATARIAVLEGQVKRAEPAPSAVKQPHAITGRMALLKPRPPRITPLQPPLPAEPTFPPPSTLSPPLRARPLSRPPQPARAAAPSPTRRQPTPAPKFLPPRAPRKVVPVDVVVELPRGGFFSTVLRDLSISGAFIITKRQLEVGSIVALEMRIPTPGTVTQSSHRTNARIARRTDIGCGLAFIDATPELVAAIRAIIA